MSVTNLDRHIITLTEILHRVRFAIFRLEEGQRVRDASYSRGVSSPPSTESEINNHLSGLTTLVGTEIGNTATSISTSLEAWAPEIKTSMMVTPTDWKSTAVDVDNGASGSTLTANQDDVTVIFSVFDVGDVVEISKAEDPNHNGRHTVALVTGQVLTFDATMLGKDNANDETMTITLLER